MGLRKSWNLGNGIVCDEAYIKMTGITWKHRYEDSAAADIIIGNFEIYATQEARNNELPPISQNSFSFPLDNTDERSWVVQAYEYAKILHPSLSGSVDIV
jgi:hypothetical protein|tara:strand:+ start:298 stop:597 length:300 start_codon:yes stop_codon:yes gene_type:complete